jgi:hypothetical protein
MNPRPLARGVRLMLAALLLAQAALPPDGVAAQQPVESINAGALLSEVARNERAMLQRRLEYTWTAKVTDREQNKRGEVAKETVSVYEVYPVRGEFARKLIAKDGVPVSQERADKELKRTADRLEKAAQEEQKRAEQKAPPTPTPAGTQNPNGIPSVGFSTKHRHGNGFTSSEIWLSVWRFFRYGEFAAPRHERVRGRDTIVLDFRPRADFRPADESQRPYARLAGRLWIDAEDKAVVRLEAWPSDAQTAARPAEPAVIFEHERVADGVWLEHLVRINTYGHKDIFNGIELDSTKEAADFRRFNASTGDEKLDTPKP